MDPLVTQTPHLHGEVIKMHIYHNKMAEYKHAEQIYKIRMCGMSYINIDTVCSHP